MSDYLYGVEHVEELLDIAYEEKDWIIFHSDEIETAKLVINDDVSDEYDKEYAQSVIDELNNSIERIKESIDTIDNGMKTGIIYTDGIITAYNDLSNFISTYTNG